MKKILTFLFLLLSFFCFSQPIETWIEKKRSCPGNDIVIPIKVKNFNNVSAISLKLNYNNSFLTFNGFQNINPLISNMILNNINGFIFCGIYTYNVYNLSDSATLFEMKFHYNFNDSCVIKWDLLNMGACEYADANGNILPSIFIDGGVFNQSICGYIKYYNISKTPISNCKIYLIRNNIKIDSTFSNIDGYYKFSCLEPGEYNFDIEKNDNWGGVNSNDALLIAKHYIEYLLINDNFILRASDLDNNNIINATDCLLIMKRFTGSINNFIIKDWIVDNINNINVNNINLVTINNDINVICVGDVDRSYIP